VELQVLVQLEGMVVPQVLELQVEDQHRRAESGHMISLMRMLLTMRLAREVGVRGNALWMVVQFVTSEQMFCDRVVSLNTRKACHLIRPFRPPMHDLEGVDGCVLGLMWVT